MGIFELLIIAVGLSMDAFAIAICTGLTLKRFRAAEALTVGLYFGAAQAAMPVIGYFIGGVFADKIASFDHWVAFGLLAFIGGKMLADSRAEKEVPAEHALRFSKIFPLAIATSIDALAVGISFAFLDVSILPAASFIGIVTLSLSIVGVRVGAVFGARFRSWATVAGGLMLIAIGVKILFEHLLAG